MRRLFAVVAAVIVMLAGLVAIGRIGPVMAAQEGTPAADEGGMPEGVTFEVLGTGRPAPLVSTRVEVSLVRVGLSPGATLEFPEDESQSTALLYVESGSLTFRFGTPVTVSRVATGDQEEVPADTEFTVEAGDFFIAPPIAAVMIRNDGQEPAAVLSADTSPLGPGADAEATPTS